MNPFLAKIRSDTAAKGSWLKRTRERNKPREVSVAKGVYVVDQDGRKYVVVAENFDRAKERLKQIPEA